MSDPVTTRRAVRTVPLDDFEPHPENPKAHDLDAIITSIRRFGFADPVVVDQRTGLTVSGHGRIEALQTMRDRGDDPPPGVEDWKVPTYVGWASADDDGARGMIVALNRLTETGGWDDQALAGLLDQLATVDNGLDGIGYVGDDLDELRAKLDALDRDDPWDRPPPDPLPDARTVLGDVWQIGPHRIACGDAADRDVYSRLLDAPADLLLTDPPYGVAYGGGGKARVAIDNDDLSGDDLRDFLAATLGQSVDAVKPGACVYVFAPPGTALRPFVEVLDDMDVWRWSLVWAKNNATFSRADYHMRHEMVLYGWKPGAAHQTPDEHTHTTVWEFDRPTTSDDHPTAKPVDLLRFAIGNSASPGQVVLDPFAGSGSTLIAAAAEGCRGYGIELSPSYVDVTVARLVREIGEPAVHVDTGEPFDGRAMQVEAAG